MRNQTYNPLTCIPAPETLRRHLAEAETLARRLRLLLRLSEKLRDCREEEAVERGGTSDG